MPLPSTRSISLAATASCLINLTAPPFRSRRISPKATADSPKTDRKNFFGIARGSVQECVPLLELARRRGLIKDDHYNQLKLLLEELSKMLSGLIKGLEKREV